MYAYDSCLVVNGLNRKPIIAAGVFLVVLGVAFLGIEIWYACRYGFPHEISARDLLLPELSGDVLWLISVSCATIVLGLFFLLWAHRIPKNVETERNKADVLKS